MRARSVLARIVFVAGLVTLFVVPCAPPAPPPAPGAVRAAGVVAVRMEEKRPGPVAAAAGGAEALAAPTEAGARPAAGNRGLRHGATPADSRVVIPVPRAFRRAVEAGTRTPTGEPGPRYWQQRVDYVIEASLEPATALLRGSERIRYRNNSPDTLQHIFLHLYQNIFAPGNPRNRPVPVTGGMTVDRLVVQGRPRLLPPPERPLPTIVAVELERPLAPGGEAELSIDWHFTVPPPGAPRTGHDNREVFAIAQWYPQIAVYDDVRGWHRDPYLGEGEFYTEYGDFDVTLRVPAGWLVAATGVLQNPEEVLTDETRRRLAAALETDTVVHVLTERDVKNGTLTRPAPDGWLTWRYRAENVRDFAWAASNRYLWDATRAASPDADGDGQGEVVAIHVLYRPGKRNWDQGARFARHAVETHAANWYPYPYPHMTVTEGVISGGMEYPMITFIGGERSPFSLYTVISHEIGHMWFPMMVGSNETAYAWMDEGLTTFIENLAAELIFPEERPRLSDARHYLEVAGSDNETEIMRHADLYGPFGNRGVASYSKPAAVLTALRHVLGTQTFDRALREYVRRWFNRHPMPHDLFNTFESVAGRDLDWFWYPWFYTTRVLDQAVNVVRQERTAAGYRVTVVVGDLGEIPMPIDLALTLDNGQTMRVLLDVEAWNGLQEYTFQSEVPRPLARVELDPDAYSPDVNRENNVWVARRP